MIILKYIKRFLLWFTKSHVRTEVKTVEMQDDNLSDFKNFSKQKPKPGKLIEFISGEPEVGLYTDDGMVWTKGVKVVPHFWRYK